MQAFTFYVSEEGGALTLGGLSQCPSYLSGIARADVQKEFRKQTVAFVEEGMDFLLCCVLVWVEGRERVPAGCLQVHA